MKSPEKGIGQFGFRCYVSIDRHEDRTFVYIRVL